MRSVAASLTLCGSSVLKPLYHWTLARRDTACKAWIEPLISGSPAFVKVQW